MFTTLNNLVRGAAADAEDALIEANALRLAEQKLRDATAAHEGGKRTLSQMILERRGLDKRISQTQTKLAKTEEKAVTAIQAGREDLAELAASQMHSDQGTLTALQSQVEQLSLSASKLRAKLETGESKLIALRQGVQLAKAQERDRSVSLSLSRNLTSASALKEADDLLARANRRTRHEELFDVYESVDQQITSGGDLDDAFDAAGLGDGPKSRTAEILETLKQKAAADAASAA